MNIYYITLYVMQSLSAICSRASLKDTRSLPVECLEKLVDSCKVYGVMVLDDHLSQKLDRSVYGYESFYSSRRKAEDRVLCILLGMPDHKEVLQYLSTPSEEKRRQLIDECVDLVIVDITLNPCHPMNTVYLYLEIHVTNVRNEALERKQTGGWGTITNVTRYLPGRSCNTIRAPDRLQR